MENSIIPPSMNRMTQFFDSEVSMYILGDIDRLTNEIRPDRNTGLCGCTVPLAMTLFAVIDLFGYLTRDGAYPKKTDTCGNFKYLMSEKANFFPKIYNENYKKIVKLFRHGLIHQFFPKASAIAKAGLDVPLIFETQAITTLNVDILSKDVKAALEKIRNSIVVNHDSNLAERMCNRLDRLAKEDYETLNLPKLNALKTVAADC